jgi:hypothetical protein
VELLKDLVLLKAAKASAVNQMEAFGGAANAGKLSSDSGILVT